MARQNELLFAQRIAGGVQSGQQALGGGFLVAGGAVELTRTVQSPHHLAFQRGFQTGGVHAVVLDGVGRAHDLDVLKAPDAAVKGVLHILRQAAGGTLQIHLFGVLAAGFHKNGVAVLARKAHHLVLDGGAVTRADTLDHAAVQRAALDVVQNDLVGLRVRVGDPAFHLVVHGGVGHEAEGLQLVVRVTRLTLQPAEVDAAPVHTGGGAGLEPPQGQTGSLHKDLAAQIGAGGQHHALCGVLAVELGNDALHPAVFHLKAHHLGLMDGKAGGKLQCVLHVFVVAFAVGLHPQCVHRRALALVQHPTLQVGGIRRQTHHAAKGI